MLEELAIYDFALIERVTVSWKDGFNVLTGETGAGKSIIIDALNIVLGGKASPNLIRPGAERAVIEATFRNNARVLAWLKQEGLVEDELGALVVCREISRSGSRARINGTLVNVALLNDLKQMLVTIHAQHEARTLLSPQSQLEMLDGLADGAHQKLLEKLRTLYARRQELSAQISELVMSEEERLRRLDFARFQWQELEDAALGHPDEDEGLAAQCRILANVRELELSAATAHACLTGGEAAEAAGAIDLVQKALLSVSAGAAMDGQLVPLADALAASADSLQDAARSLRRYRESLDTDPETLAALESRNAQLATIKRKYGPALSDAIGRRDELGREISRLENAQAESESLEEELAAVEAELAGIAGELSRKRKVVAERLASAIEKEVAELGMERCRFQVSFETSEVGAGGCDRVEFLISPNPGQPLQPVSRIASGGELSRVMLALKSIVAGADETSTVVFDEIDAGLSGKVLLSMRDKLARLARSHQILCITHQPIIASVADNHIAVSKVQSEERTQVSVRLLDEESRVSCLAGMAGGQEGEKAALGFARTLYAEGRRLRTGSPEPMSRARAPRGKPANR